ncbi:DNA repair protein rad2 [Tilletia horrida]|nr:DNA repair protein rad2 [Tilletia horrida]
MKLETLEGQRLAIDSSIWLYHFQNAMRDKEGRTLSNAHILGFLWRILKLLFYGIRPVFVFDGAAPVLKRRTLANRKTRKEGAKETHARTAEKLLAAQLRAAAVKHIASGPELSAKARGKQRAVDGAGVEQEQGGAAPSSSGGIVYLDDLRGASPAPAAPQSPAPAINGDGDEDDFSDSDVEARRRRELYSERATPAKRPKPATIRERVEAEQKKRQAEQAAHSPDVHDSAVKKRRKNNDWHKDQYDLPPLEQPLELIGSSKAAEKNDIRFATDEELRALLAQLAPEDLDTSSEAFRSLPFEMQYELVGDARLQSRGTSYKRLQAMLKAAPTAIDFSRAQVAGLKTRNELTQRVLEVTDEIGHAHIRVEGVSGGKGRVEGARGKEYVLLRNEGAEGGWVLGVRTDGQSAQDAIQIGDDNDDDDDDDGDGDGSGPGRSTKWFEHAEESMRKATSSARRRASASASDTPARNIRKQRVAAGSRASVSTNNTPRKPPSIISISDDEVAHLQLEEAVDTAAPDRSRVTPPPRGRRSVEDENQLLATPASISTSSNVSIEDFGADAYEGLYDLPGLANEEPGIHPEDQKEEEEEIVFDDNGDPIGVFLPGGRVQGFLDEAEDEPLPGPSSTPARQSNKLIIPKRPADFIPASSSSSAKLSPKTPRSQQPRSQPGSAQLKTPSSAIFVGLPDSEDEDDVGWMYAGSQEVHEQTEEDEDTRSQLSDELEVVAQSPSARGWPSEHLSTPASALVRESVSPEISAVDEGVKVRDFASTAAVHSSPRSKQAPAVKTVLTALEPAGAQSRASGSAQVSMSASTSKPTPVVVPTSAPAPAPAPAANHSRTQLPADRSPSPDGSATSALGMSSAARESFTFRSAPSKALSLSPSASPISLNSPHPHEDHAPRASKTSPVRSPAHRIQEEEEYVPEEEMELPPPAVVQEEPLFLAEEKNELLDHRSPLLPLRSDSTEDGASITGDSPSREAMDVDEDDEDGLSDNERRGGLQYDADSPDEADDSNERIVGPDGLVLPTRAELEAFEAEDAQDLGLEDDQDEFATFLSKTKGRSLREVQEEIEAEVASLKAQHANTRRSQEEITQQMVREIQLMLRLFGLPYITAPAEAEAQCAELVQRQLVDGIITDDSDVFLFGGTRVYKNMFNQHKVVECYMLSDLEREMGISRQKLVSLAYLLGSDYTEGLTGVGPVTAMEVLATFFDEHAADRAEARAAAKRKTLAKIGADAASSFEGQVGLIRFRDWWMKVQMGQDKAPLPEPVAEHADPKLIKRIKRSLRNKVHLSRDWPSPAVLNAYYEPVVDTSDENFQWGLPDLDSVRMFLGEYLKWSTTKTDQYVLPVIEAQNRRAKAKQTTLDQAGFLGTSAIGQGQSSANEVLYAGRARPQVRSTRLQEVIDGFRRAKRNAKTSIGRDGVPRAGSSVADALEISGSSGEEDGLQERAAEEGEEDESVVTGSSSAPARGRGRGRGRGQGRGRARGSGRGRGSGRAAKSTRAASARPEEDAVPSSADEDGTFGASKGGGDDDEFSEWSSDAGSDYGSSSRRGKAGKSPSTRGRSGSRGRGRGRGGRGKAPATGSSPASASTSTSEAGAASGRGRTRGRPRGCGRGAGRGTGLGLADARRMNLDDAFDV